MRFKDATLFFLIINLTVCISISTLTISDSNTTYLWKNHKQIIGGDNTQIKITNNPNATDVTYLELIQFIQTDKTDQIIYNDDLFVCADYAELLHNNAEKQGIRAGVVSIDYHYVKRGHMFNVFNTTDKGQILIDITEHDKIVTHLAIDDIIKMKSIDGKKIYYINDTISNIHIFW